ncbi:MAG: hypothetical protein QOJ88_1362 [Pyrinomonadaceae bacterium]|jgi:protein-tyrosine phosphatase|nr:hypothetical protein [Pyrinomonadaceae bacterium]
MKPTIYWIDHKTPGRLAILAKPHGNEELESDIEGWRAAGVDVVVSLLTDTDNAYLGLTSERELCRHHELEFVSFPIQDFGVPASFVDATLLVMELKQLLLSGKTIGFHCHGCIGRAPLIASCVLMATGVSADEAYRLISEARGYPIPEAQEQAAWGREFANHLSAAVDS